MILALGSFSKKDLEELYDAYRTRFVAGEISEDDFREFLAALGHNATSIEEEVTSAKNAII